MIFRNTNGVQNAINSFTKWAWGLRFGLYEHLHHCLPLSSLLPLRSFRFFHTQTHTHTRIIQTTYSTSLKRRRIGSTYISLPLSPRSLQIEDLSISLSPSLCGECFVLHILASPYICYVIICMYT